MKKISITIFLSIIVATIMYASFPVVIEPVNEIPTIIEQAATNTAPVSDNVDWPLAIVCFFLGALGVHQFMLGNTGKGLLYLFTGGLCGIGWLIDIIKICTGDISR